MMREKIQREIENLFKDPVKSILLNHLKPCIAGILKENGSVALGKSKLGGQPDLPVDMSYPTPDGQLCEFFLQLNMEELKPFDTNNLLPAHGLLSIFCQFYRDKEEDEDAFEQLPELKSQFFGIFNDNLSNLERKTIPTSLTATSLNEFSIQFGNYYNTIHSFDHALNGIDVDINSEITLDEKIATICGYSSIPELILLGNTQFMADNASYDWKRFFLEISYHKAHMEKENVDRLIQNLVMNFVSLVQLRTNERHFKKVSGWGGEGDLNIGIDRSDLSNRKVDSLSYSVIYG
jgi:uncharacterized protein YwqG